jgi:hypothetical protein
VCDKSIRTAQKTRIETAEGVQWEAIDDCLGHPNGTEIDNIEDLDTVVDWLAEPVRLRASPFPKRNFKSSFSMRPGGCSRPVFHLQFQEGVLQQGRHGMGDEQRAGGPMRATQLALIQ